MEGKNTNSYFYTIKTIIPKQRNLEEKSNKYVIFYFLIFNMTYFRMERTC